MKIQRQITKITDLQQLHNNNNIYIIPNEPKFKTFLCQLIKLLKTVKSEVYNICLPDLIGLAVKKTEPNTLNFNFIKRLKNLLRCENVVISNMSSYRLFTENVRHNKSNAIRNLNYLTLPNIACWDRTYVTTLYRLLYNSDRNSCIGTQLQNKRMSFGTIPDQIQNKASFAGQNVYSTQLKTSTFIANVVCYNAANEVIPPVHYVNRYYGRKIPQHVKLRAFSNRHPDISQLSTQSVIVNRQARNNSNTVKIGLGTFMGANRDCDGDKEIITFAPYPNNILQLETMLYMEPTHNMIKHDKLRLQFCPQQVLYLFKKRNELENLLEKYSLINMLWFLHSTLKFEQRLKLLINDTTLLLGSNVACNLFKELLRLIDTSQYICTANEILNIDGVFEDIVNSGAKGTQALLQQTRNKKTMNKDCDEIHKNARDVLSHYIESHNNVRITGQGMYISTSAFQDVYYSKSSICFQNDNVILSQLYQLPEGLLFSDYLTTFVIDCIEQNIL